MQTVKLRSESTFNVYQNTCYSQSVDTAMGSPITTTIDNLALEDLENKEIPSRLNFMYI